MQKLFRLLSIYSILLATMATTHAESKVYEYRLNNGLKLLVKPDHRSPVIFTSVWYKVGGSYEHNGITGISHVLEHMMFRGTSRFGPGVLEKMVSVAGGQQNAMTANDFTMYYQVLPSNKLELSFMLEADRMQHLLLREQDFKKELQVVMEERRMRFDDNPQTAAWERFLAAAYVNNPYHHQAIGWMTDLENLTDKNVKDWYHAWYHPNNAIVVVVGDVESNKVKALAQKYFGRIKAQAVSRLKPRIEVQPLGKVETKINLTAKLPVLFMGYKTSTLTTTKVVWQPYALDVLANILGGSSSFRLETILVREKQLATSIDVSYNPFNLHSNILQITVVPAHGHTAQELEQAVIMQITQLKKKQVTQSELERVKAQMTASKVFSRDSLEQQGMLLGVPMVIGLPWQTGENYIEEINRVTQAQVQAVAKQFLIEKALTVSVLQPQSMDSMNTSKK